MPLNPPKSAVVIAAGLLILNAAPALAYTGPGLGLGAIGSALGVVAALLLMLLSIIWYPAKRLLRRMRGEKAQSQTTERPAQRSSGAKRP